MKISLDSVRTVRSKRAASTRRLYRARRDRARCQLNTLLLKLILTPTLITAATLLGRRFGQSVAGWLIGFPWTSAPVSFFLALDHGIPFAAAAARGSLTAIAAECAFALAYARTTRGWQASLAAGSAAYVVAALAFRDVAIDPLPLAALMAALLLLASRLLPRAVRTQVAAAAAPAWDLPARVIVATAIVLGITAVAPTLGPYGSALLASFPLFASILSVFGERHAGHGAAIDVMRGLTAGLVGFGTFFLVISLALEPLGLVAFPVAVVVTLAAQAVSFALLRRADRLTEVRSAA